MKIGYLFALASVGLCLCANAAKDAVLVVCAHPDDSIAVAGTLFLMKDRFDIHIADLTKGQARDIREQGKDGPMAARRMKEEHAAAALVGAKVHWLGFVDGQLYATPEACKAMAGLITEIKPRVIFSMWPIDRHQDHSMSGAIALKGAMLANFNGEFYYYEEVYGSKGFVPMHYVDVTHVAEKKKQFIRCHESQNGNEYLVNVEMHGAKGRGSQAMYRSSRPYVECFMPLPGFLAQGSKCIFTELPKNPGR